MGAKSAGAARRASSGLPAAEAMRRGVALHHAGRYAAAEALYREVLAGHPDHADAAASLAMILHHRRRYDEALALLARARLAQPDNPGYLMNTGAVQVAVGQFDAAAMTFRQAIDLAPRYADPYYSLGDLYLRQGDPQAAVALFDACMAENGRDFHALAYKAHALRDAGRLAESDYLLDFDTYLRAYPFEPPAGFADLESINAALAAEVAGHPTLQANVMSTEHGEHTGELLRGPAGAMRAMERRIHEAVRWYLEGLPDDPAHPMVRHALDRWKLTTWGVVMFDQGHERAHIHPNGWLSGVFYLQLPDVINDPARAPEGWLEFGRPTSELHVRSEPALRHCRPAYGQMFLFPSYFYHGTVPFRSRQRRICVAFDVEPLP